MFKVVILLKRKETMSFDDFAKWWLDDHAPLARTLPGLRRAVFNLVNTGDDQEDRQYDGISELWFDTQSDFTHAYETEIGKQVAADSMCNVSKRDRLLVTEAQIFPL
ncbi:MAG: EthD family reductase [Gammaproteobacteria bacterium]|nr:EthD family reductase [Gammaproteobacteria bacterium]